MTRTVLHIEDNPSNRKVVRHILRLTDYHLVEAATGEEGITAAACQRPDLILLDLQLPGMSGYEVARRLRADERLRGVPIIALTSYALSGDEDKALEAGCDGYIAKPYRPQVLLARLRDHL